MIFSAPSFLFLFLPAVMAIYALIPSAYRRYAILLFNLAYYVIASRLEPMDILLVLLTATFTYSAGFLVAVTHKRRTLAAAVAVDVIAFLVFRFSYAASGDRTDFPLGAAIYFLAAISYLVDIYRNDAPHAKNIAELLIYLLFFPTILVGPIIRYKDFGRMLDEADFTLERFAEGVRLFAMGLLARIGLSAVLVFILDRLGESVQEATSIPVTLIGMLLLGLAAWTGLAGLSAMARGLMLMLGMSHPSDFPLLRPGASPAEFVRRFYGSLGRWVEAYLIHPVLRRTDLSPRTRRIAAAAIACAAPLLWLVTDLRVLIPALPIFVWRTIHILREGKRVPSRTALSVGRVCFALLTGLCFLIFWAVVASRQADGLSRIFLPLASLTADIPYAAFHALSFLTYLIPAAVGLLCLTLIGPTVTARISAWPRGAALSVQTVTLVVGMLALAFTILHLMPQFPAYATEAFRYLVL